MSSASEKRDAAAHRIRRRMVLAGALLLASGCSRAVEPAVWFLPEDSPPDATASSVRILVDSSSCSSGRGAVVAGRPQVTLTAEEVIIGVEAYAPRGSQSCPGSPLTPVAVDLGQPLGDRVLVDRNGTTDDQYAPPESRYQGIVVPPAASAPPTSSPS